VGRDYFYGGATTHNKDPVLPKGKKSKLGPLVLYLSSSLRGFSKELSNLCN